MAKMKSKRGWAKRVKIRKSGSLSRRKAGLRHQLVVKAKKRKRNLKRPATLTRSDRRRIKGFFQ